MKELLIAIIFLTSLNVGQAQTIDTLVNVGGHKLHFNITKLLKEKAFQFFLNQEMATTVPFGNRFYQTFIGQQGLL